MAKSQGRGSDGKGRVDLGKGADNKYKGSVQGPPYGICDYLDHIYSSRRGDTPKDPYLCGIFSNLFKGNGFDYDYVTDWTILEYLRVNR